MPKPLDLTGKEFGRITVERMEIRRLKNGDTASFAVCNCSCGNKGKIVQAGLLMRGNVRSCGCLAREVASVLMTTHGMHRSREFRSWQSMIQRCENPCNAAYKDYGGRGIKVADEFKSFERFYSELGPRPPRFSLDRIRTEGNYEPGNVRWASAETQNRNKRSNILISYDNRTQTLSEWANERKLPQGTLWGRIHRGWCIEDALNAPANDKHPGAKLCEKDVVDIFRMRKDGNTIRIIADKYGVHQSTVILVLRRKNWPSVLLPNDLVPYARTQESVKPAMLD